VCKTSSKNTTFPTKTITMKKRKIIPYHPYLKEYARRLRNNPTKSERILWKYLKGKKMRGYDFHRQKPLGHFIVDFFCYELSLVIELDGQTHQWEETAIRDAEKEATLNKLGLNILRFQDRIVFDEIQVVLRNISGYVDWFENGGDV